MTKPALVGNIHMLNETNEHHVDKSKCLGNFHWVSDYAHDIFQTLKESEMQRRRIRFLSRQIDYRQQLIQLCQLIIRTYKLSRCALHLSIYYLDRFMDVYTVRADKLQLVALTCLHIAAQIENRDAFVPRYSDMNRIVMNSYTLFEYKAVERKVLTFFDFQLMRPTTASFVEMLSCKYVTRDDYVDYNKSLDESPVLAESLPRFESLEQMMASLASVLLLMADYTLNFYKLSNDQPSLLAAACIAAVRQVSGLPKVWTPFLTTLTSYTENMVEPYVKIITLYHFYHSPGHVVRSHKSETLWQSPDSGFEEQLLPPRVKVVAASKIETFNFISLKLEATDKENTSRKRSRDYQYEVQDSKRSKLDQT
ncbi:cyclin-J [Drosophila albomicans]|uniref:Cyclin-J n=1 Tax=Drosophila albomicans TaxID=7291 RepID=A0A6P8X3G3_DROAB|nr:cyclin-J [Drosophila albomicans]